MFAQKNRLPIKETSKELRRIFSSPVFVVKTADNKTRNRFGIIISNNAVRKSTRRHFWKRAFISNLKQWPNIQKDVLFIISQKIEEISKAGLKKEIEKTFKFLTAKH